MSDNDYLRCTECRAETNTKASDLYESMGKTKAGKPRKRTAWIKTLGTLVSGWLCDACLTRAEREAD